MEPKSRQRAANHMQQMTTCAIEEKNTPCKLQNEEQYAYTKELGMKVGNWGSDATAEVSQPQPWEKKLDVLGSLNW
eukprot:4033610-Amphidinium_carterae.1